MTKHFQCIGVGCGPSNLSIAALLSGRKEVSSVFLDRKSEFSWHNGLMMNHATIQVSPFKDLVTLADPTNPYSFISYLHQHGRLYHFLNARFDHVSRREFHDYLRWVSERLDSVVFGEEVLAIDFRDDAFTVETSQRQITGDNVVIGVGVQPNLPSFVRPHLDGVTQFHVQDFADRSGITAGKRVAVVGGGQSGAEVVAELIGRTGSGAPAAVTWISRRDNFLPLDDSAFTNEFFTPAYSDYFYGQDRSFRNAFIARHVLASDGISEHTLRLIYQRIYMLRFIYKLPMAISLLPSREVEMVWPQDGGWLLAAKHTSTLSQEVIGADVVIWATGFRPTSMRFLDPLRGRLEWLDDELRIDSDFAVCWDGPQGHNLFLLNAARRQRGLADPNLSLTAWRSRMVIHRLLGYTGGLPAEEPSFVSWATKQIHEMRS
jgi:lysine N6-hydroxylase